MYRATLEDTAPWCGCPDLGHTYAKTLDPILQLLVSPQHTLKPPAWRQAELENADPNYNLLLLHTELESNPDISINTSFVVEYMGSVAAFCHTNATNIKWYVSDIPVFSNDPVIISPDGKTLIIYQVTRYDTKLQCAMENILGFFQRSEKIFLTVACEWSGVMGIKPGVGLRSSRDVRIRRAEPERGNILSRPDLGSNPSSDDLALWTSDPHPQYSEPWSKQFKILKLEIV